MAKKRNENSTLNVAEKAEKPLAKNLTVLIGKDVAKIADYLDCTPQAINQYKLGVSVPQTEKLIKIAKYYNVSVDYLLGLSDVKSTDPKVKEICEYTGLSENALNKILKEKDHCCIKQLNQIIEDKDFWNIVDFFCNYRNTATTISERNAEYSNLYLESIKDENNEEIQKACETLETALNRAKYEYDMNRFKCKLLFEKIVDKFLPKV